ARARSAIDAAPAAIKAIPETNTLAERARPVVLKRTPSRRPPGGRDIDYRFVYRPSRRRTAPCRRLSRTGGAEMLPKLGMSLLATCAVAAGAWLAPEPVAAESLNPIKIDEWDVPFGGRARDPFAVSEDEVWFVGQRGHYVARFQPSTGEFFKRDLPDEAGPHNLIVGSDGIVWHAGNLRGYIGRYDPKTDTIEKIEMTDPAARDPHTLVFDAGEEHIWFTVQGG